MSKPDETALSAAVQAVMNEGYDPDEAEAVARAAVEAYQRKMVELIASDDSMPRSSQHAPVPTTAARAWSGEDDDDGTGD